MNRRVLGEHFERVIICSVFLVLLLILPSCASRVVDSTETSPQLSPSLILPNVTNTAFPTPTIFVEAYPTEVLTPFPDPTAASVTSFPDPKDYTWQVVAQNFDRPLDLAFPKNRPNEMFVVEQGGVIWIVKEGQRLAQPFLDIRDRVRTDADERGLLGIALHPDFSNNGYFYLNYTGKNAETVIARFSALDGSSAADSGSERILLRVDQPFKNHNGGGLAFGPDGYLYIALGDGGSAGDPLGSGQSLTTFLGKILRIDVNVPDGYAIPPDNPFRATDGSLSEIWAYGLRNPWRFSFDSFTGDLYIADVGQDAWEEINFLPANSAGGANFGWNYREGSHAYAGQIPSGLTLIDPIWEYDHLAGESVTGGVVYRGKILPEWRGIYVFGDFISGTVWGLLQNGEGKWHAQQMFSTSAYISAFSVDQFGEVYMLDLQSGQIYRLVAANMSS